MVTDTVAGPQVWNNMSTDIRQLDLSRISFRQLLKSYLFGQWDRSVAWIRPPTL